MPDSYFTRDRKIKSHSQMIETLKARTSHAVGQSPKVLTWEKPVRNKDGSGHQVASGTDYVIRKTQSNGEWVYWAWSGKNLLGYSGDVELARANCQAHHLKTIQPLKGEIR